MDGWVARALIIGGTLLPVGCTDFVGAEGGGDGDSSDASASTTEASTMSTSDVTSDVTSAGSDSATTSMSATTDGTGAPTTTPTTSPEGSSTTEDPTAESSSDTGEPDAVCGNGRPEAGEDCDDGNGDENDGCLSTCVVPRSCAEVLAEIPGARDGAYDIAPDGNVLTTACDMTTAGGGWTLVGKINHANTNDVDEPEGWFGTESNSGGLASPTLSLNQSPQSHGAARFSSIIDAGVSLTRFELIEGGSVDESVEWFKIVETTASFEAWFSEDDPDESLVCNDVDMTTNCRDGDIERSGSASNNVTRLGGMQSTDYYPGGDSFPIHIRQNNNNGSGPSGMISGTIGIEEWSQGYGDHLGNGLRIWLRE